MNPASRAMSNQPFVSAGRGDLHGLLRLLLLLLAAALAPRTAPASAAMAPSVPPILKAAVAITAIATVSAIAAVTVGRRGRRGRRDRETAAGSLGAGCAAGRVGGAFIARELAGPPLPVSLSRGADALVRRCVPTPLVAASSRSVRSDGTGRRCFAPASYRSARGREPRLLRARATRSDGRFRAATAIERRRDTDCRWSLATRPVGRTLSRVRDEGGVDVRSCHCWVKR